MDMSSFHPTFSAFILSYVHPVPHPSCLDFIFSSLLSMYQNQVLCKYCQKNLQGFTGQILLFRKSNVIKKYTPCRNFSCQLLRQQGFSSSLNKCLKIKTKNFYKLVFMSLRQSQKLPVSSKAVKNSFFSFQVSKPLMGEGRCIFCRRDALLLCHPLTGCFSSAPL